MGAVAVHTATHLAIKNSCFLLKKILTTISHKKANKRKDKQTHTKGTQREGTEISKNNALKTEEIHGKAHFSKCHFYGYWRNYGKNN